jgi:hypothetical protein
MFGWIVMAGILSRKKQTLQSDPANVVATGLWPVDLSAVFTLRRRPIGPRLQPLRLIY